MEIRAQDDKFFFTDPTPRGPVPGSGTQMEIYGNLAEIIAAGAQGELVEPEPVGAYSAECALTIKAPRGMWPSVQVPAELKQWMKLGGWCQVNGRTWFPVTDEADHDDSIGWLVAIGDTPKETIETILERAAALPEGVCAATDSLVDLLKEIDEAESKGIEFSPHPLPDPAIVVEQS